MTVHKRGVGVYATLCIFRVAHRKIREISEVKFSEIFRKFRVTPLENRNIGNRVSNLPEELW